AAVEPVAWSAAESYLLAGMFGIWSVVALLYGINHNKSGLYWLIPVILSICACISNETGLGIPPLLILLCYVWQPHITPAKQSLSSSIARLKPRAGVIVCFFFVLVAYFSLRFMLFGAITKYAVGPSPEPVTKLGEYSDFFKTTAGKLLWNY